jgi:hypothetical protein
MRLIPCSQLQAAALALLFAAPLSLSAQNVRAPIGPELPPEMRTARESRPQGVQDNTGLRNTREQKAPGAIDAGNTVEGPTLKPGINAQPAIKFETTFVDLGTMDEGKTANARFPFVNTSDQTVTITAINTTCGCTAAVLAKKVFAPGEGDEISITFNSTNRPGINDRIIRVITDEPAVSSYGIRIRADVTQELWLSQRTAVFGDVPIGETRTVSLDLISVGEVPLEVLNVVNSRNDVKVALGDPIPYSSGARTGMQIPVQVTLPADLPAGRLSGNVALKTNQPSDKGNINIIYQANVVGAVAFNPARLYFGAVPPNTSQIARGSITVTKGDEPFVLESWEVLPARPANNAQAVTPAESLPKIEVTLADPMPGTTMQAVEAKAQLTDFSGHVQGTLVLTGRVGTAVEKVQIPISAYVRDISELQRAQAVPAPISPQTTERKMPAAVQQETAGRRIPAPISPETGERKMPVRGEVKAETKTP